MNDKTRMTNDESDGRPPHGPLQYSLRTLLGIMVAVGVLFGTLRWLNVSQSASVIVLIVLIVSVAAALGLLIAIAGAADDDNE